MVIHEGDELLMWCGYCGGRAVKAQIGWEHESAGDRVKVSPGDFVSGKHNLAGTRVMPYDLVDADEVQDERLTVNPL